MGSLALLLRMVFLLTFVGWLFIWVMLPTKAYKQTWTPRLKSNLNSTYFLEQGTNLLLLTFPIMFIAALGGVYLHFQNSIKESNTKSVHRSQRLAFLKRPILVMAPLGIVSIMELTFAVMFVVLMIWFLANYLYISFGALHMDTGVEVWQSKFRSVSLRLGYVGNLTWAFLFFPVTRGSTILPLFGLTSESSIKYHIWLGHLSMILFFLHSVGFFIYWGMTHLMVEALEWSRTYVSNVAGEIAFVISLAMWVTSFSRFRRKMYEVFFYSHHLYTVFLLFYILHVGVAYLCMILPGIFLFLIDRYLRFLQSRHRAMLVSVRLLPCDTVELNFCKSPGLRYSSLSIMFVNVPKISKLQWHPFTIISSCNLESSLLSIVIKNQGSWSQKLYRELCSPLDHLDISVEGPYDPASSHILSRESLVMICGGSGVTPFISIIREIMYQSTQPNCRIPKLLLVCAFKNSSDLTMLELLLPMIGTPLDLSKIEIQIQAYITQEHEIPTSDTKKLIQTVWFKPSPSDSPISAALGPNSWLWLSAIITSSFVMFLLLLAIVTRYYIYPRDHDSDNMPYHYSFRILWDMFLVCICVVICSSAIFLWQKKRNGNEQKQIQNFEIPTPKSSPAGAGLYGEDRVEVESLPHQSIVQATKVYYGERPDLKNILFGCKETDVGVLVCGPKKMRHEVAKICSSGLAQNLHFESISFSW